MATSASAHVAAVADRGRKPREAFTYRAARRNHARALKLLWRALPRVKTPSRSIIVPVAPAAAVGDGGHNIIAA